MKVIKQCFGIDISKATIDVVLCKKFMNQDYSFSKVESFENSTCGFNKFLKWGSKRVDSALDVHYAMEATGTYHELLAYHLYKINKRLHVILPNKVAHFTKSLNIKSKTDPIDAKVIAMLCCDRLLIQWCPPSDLFRELKSLCRLYESLNQDKVITINRLKHLEVSYKPLKEAVRIYKLTIKRLEKSLLSIESNMKDLLRSDPEVWAKVENLLTIKGVGLKTVAIILGETQGFAQFKNQRQLVSYCGLDVSQKQSGSSVKSKTKISKKGNSHIRSALFMPAMSAIRCNPKMRATHLRIIANKPSRKIGVTAIQRRLLVLMYSLCKNDLPFIENYEQKATSGIHELEVPSSLSTHGVDLGIIEKVDAAEARIYTE